uniref:Fe2OG dioxygenase domain-containing protein n=1 Tax=Amphimedon queenslandica TaxID=400682 RepID=A0A1X7UX57_AMPQE
MAMMDRSSSVSSLEGTAHMTVVSSLGKVVSGLESRFACGGSISESTVLISYKKKSGEWSPQPLKLPSTDSTVLQDLLQSCSVASFGLGSQTVTDKDYRDALKLDTDCYITNLNLLNTPIPSTIEKVMDISSPIRAELYKMNIYCTGGHFKSHVDTPRSKDMFGSLVVCLPSPFTGGELVTRHNGRQVTFDWSRDSNTLIQWGAFFSDVEHEVLPVGSGHRITLTYNLYYQETSPTIRSFDVTCNLFYKELQAALHSPHFMREGGILGFYSQHWYNNKSLANTNTKKFARYLKGPDALVYCTAKSLGLHVAIKPLVWRWRYGHGDDNRIVANKFRGFLFEPEEIDYEEDEDFDFYLLFDPHVSFREITWCQSKPFLDEISGCATFYDGNDTTAELYCQTAALLICVPQYTRERSSGSGATKYPRDNLSEAMNICFPKALTKKGT